MAPPTTTFLRRGRWLSRRPGILLAALGLVVACRGGPGDPPPEEPTARIALFREPESLDPLVLDDTFAWTISRNLFEGLVIRDFGGGLRPAIASSWSNPDDRTWDLVLREGVRFHDGTSVGVADAVASLRRAREDPRSAYTGNLATVDGIVALDDRRLRITTKVPDPLLLYRLLEIPILRGGDGGRVEGGEFEPIGTGPYRLVSRRPGEELEIELFGGGIRGCDVPSSSSSRRRRRRAGCCGPERSISRPSGWTICRRSGRIPAARSCRSWPAPCTS